MQIKAIKELFESKIQQNNFACFAALGVIIWSNAYTFEALGTGNAVALPRNSPGFISRISICEAEMK